MKPAKEPRGIGKHWFTRTGVKITLALTIVLIFLVFFSHRGLFQMYRLKQEKARLDAENQKLAEENLKLTRTIHRLHNDPEMIQDLIRKELNFVKGNEVIIQLPPREENLPVKAAVLPDRPPPAPPQGTVNQKPKGRQRPALESPKTTP
ncbi:MAG: septum formation initiator family protein [Desulfobaccales bacterium]